MTDKKMLLTCFEPFGGRTQNLSRDAVMAMPDKVGGYKIEKICLPTVFSEAADRAVRAAEERRVSAVLCIGEAGDRRDITPEMIAVNLQYARIPDNKGQKPEDTPVLRGGENALFSTLPSRKMAEAISQSGLPAGVSYSAGTYVCNDLFYRVLHYFQGKETACGFIHVPVNGGLTLQQLCEGLQAAIMAV